MKQEDIDKKFIRMTVPQREELSEPEILLLRRLVDVQVDRKLKVLR